MSAAAVVGPPMSMSKPGRARRAATSSTNPSRTTRLFQATLSSERDATILGVSRQMRAKSRVTGVAAGSSSAVGQESDMSWYIRLPYRNGRI